MKKQTTPLFVWGNEKTKLHYVVTDEENNKLHNENLTLIAKAQGIPAIDKSVSLSNPIKSGDIISTIDLEIFQIYSIKFLEKNFSEYMNTDKLYWDGPQYIDGVNVKEVFDDMMRVTLSVEALAKIVIELENKMTLRNYPPYMSDKMIKASQNMEILQERFKQSAQRINYISADYGKK